MSSDSVSTEEDWRRFLQSVEAGKPVTLRGADVSEARFKELRSRLPAPGGKPALISPDFTGTVFRADVSFDGLSFVGTASFDGARFLGNASFASVTAEEVSFEAAEFSKDLLLKKASFSKKLDLSWCEVKDTLHADSVRCEKPVLWQHLRVRTLVLDHAVFDASTDIHVTAYQISAKHTVFTGGVTMWLGGADVLLDGALLNKTSLLVSGGLPQAVLRSAENVDVSVLTVHGLDLSKVELGLAHNLDKIRLRNVTFGAPSPGWRTRRRVIREEELWRIRRDPAAAEITYRALRKALEDGKDEPGAADFYFGEMEMRRWDRWQHVRGAGFFGGARALTEFLLLSTYLVLSGYGLRAGRAFVALLLLVATGTVLLALGGFLPPKATFEPVAVTMWGDITYQMHPPRSLPFGESVHRAARLASQSVLSLLSAPAQQLTPLGDWVVLVLRLTGPVLLGLLVLAVRNKLKR